MSFPGEHRKPSKKVWTEVKLCERCGHALGSEKSKRRGLCGMCDRGED